MTADTRNLLVRVHAAARANRFGGCPCEAAKPACDCGLSGKVSEAHLDAAQAFRQAQPESVPDMPKEWPGLTRHTFAGAAIVIAAAALMSRCAPWGWAS